MAAETVSTEHLAQLVQDLEDAGPVATESRIYCSAIAELERRKNEEAPDAGQGVGGSETRTNAHEGTDSTVTVPNTPSCDRWDAAAAASQDDEELAIESVLPQGGLPRWWEHSAFTGGAPASAEMRSEQRWITLRRHRGNAYHRHDTVLPAHAVLSIRQLVTEREPFICLERIANVDGNRGRVDGSRYQFMLCEAEELANAILLAVAAAREGMATVVSLTTTESSAVPVDVDALREGQ